MQRLPYHVKRAHWKVTYFAIREFERKARDWGSMPLEVMTPARLDILHVIDQRLAWTKRAPDYLPVMTLGEIIRKLGLHPSTISKCVARMEQLGLVTRSRSDDDQRRTLVTLTSLGLQGIAAAFKVIAGLQERLRQTSARLGCELASLAERGRAYSREFGSRAVDLYHPAYVDTG